MSSTDERILQYKIRFQEKMNEFTEVMNNSDNNQLKSDSNIRQSSNKFSILRDYILNSSAEPKV